MKLTKSVFKMSLECPTKVFYKLNSYKDDKVEDTFLESLAEGGFQVGELAKYRFPMGIDLSENNADYGLEKTKELINKFDRVIIYEAAFMYNNLYIKVDVLVKEGNIIKFYEVKSKSYNGDEFLTKRDKTIKKEWESYIYDVFFQEYVISKCHPECVVYPFLTMPDKRKRTSVDNLNQKFFIVKEQEKKKGSDEYYLKTRIEIDDTIEIGDDILSDIDLLSIKDTVYNSEIHGRTFEKYINYLSNMVSKNSKIDMPIKKECFSCEFKDGYKECFKNKLDIKDDTFFEKKTISEIWNFRGKDKLIEDGKYLLDDITQDDILSNTYAGGAMDIKHRQWLQIEKYLNNDNDAWVNKKYLKYEMSKWKFPLHLIDFETTAIAIPFNKGMRPYEGVAFQFSHHIIEEDMTVKHIGEYVNTEVGKFPNFDFIRNLKMQLETDNGSIFMYSSHENSFLCAIYMQLIESDEIDKDELCSFIQTIAKSSSSIPKALSWELPERYMIDLLEVVKNGYYHKEMGGSNSIKYVLPAILNSSKKLQEKYSKPTYTGHNFKDKAWIEYDENNCIINPYKNLENVFKNGDDYTVIERIADGGAAMMAYAKIQFEKISDKERELVIDALKKYVELDTLSMCMLIEYLYEITN